MKTKNQRISWINYNKEKDMFELWFGYANIEWDYEPEGDYAKGSQFDYNVEILETHFQTGYYCMPEEEGSNLHEWIHWSIIKEIDNLIQNGYMFMGMNSWKK